MENKKTELFWNSTIEEIKKGYIEEEDSFQCLICGEEFVKGKIYTFDSDFYDAKKATELHIEDKHQSMIAYLLNMNTTFTGITDIQKQLLTLIAEGFTDKEIAKEMGIADSTIRNHRYKLREKEKQAKLFISMMELLSKRTKKNIKKLDDGTLCDAHKTAKALDDRFNITNEEKLEVIKNHMDSSGAIKSYPSKEKKKIILLEEITKNFKYGTIYSEKEINRILKRVYEDYATLRRALIEYGFVERSNDCSGYWVKE